jgi:hypothetical protein
MQIIPPEFVPIKYPGYYWNTRTETLFSLKYGVLRQMQLIKPNCWNKWNGPGYRISHEGKKRAVLLPALKAGKWNAKSTVFPIEWKTGCQFPIDPKSVPPGRTVRIC